MELIKIFLSFVRISTFTFGGGYTMLPLLQKEVVEKRGWATEQEVTDYFAISRALPGIIAVNTSIFIGHKRKGVPGAISAALGIAFPCIVIIVVIAAFLMNFTELEWVNHAFAGIRVTVCVLIINIVIKLYKSTVIDKWTVGIFVVVALLAAFTDISPILFVVFAGVSGIVIRKLRGGKE